jgi:PIN domain nuclease of toxin-antitoxin system
MDEIVSVHAAKTHLSQLLARVEAGEVITIAGCLPGPHRDPFDRMLIAQATLADLVLVSNEAVFDRYAVRRLW